MKDRGRISYTTSREARYRTLFERVPVALYRTTLAGALLDANPALLRMLGYPNLAALLKLNVTDLYFDPEDRARELALLARHGFVADFEMRLRRGDGAVIWVRDNARAIQQRRGRQLYYEGSLEDITARRSAEEARARREREMNALYDTSLDIHRQHELPALLQAVVERATELLGLSLGGLYLMRPEPAGDTLELAVSHHLGAEYLGSRLRVGEGAAGMAAATERPFAVEDYQAWEGHLRIYDGSGLHRMLAAPLRVGGRMLGVILIGDEKRGSFDDDAVRLISLFADQAAIAIENSRRYAQEQQRAAALAQALAQQRELDHLHNEFIQNVSHELRTPLTIVQGFAELLECGELGALAPEQREAIEIIARRTVMLGKLVEDIIAALHVEGKTLKREPVDVAELACGVVLEFRVTAAKAGLRLEDHIDLEIPPVTGDALALRRVLDNLLGNACKFTPAGGVVELWVTGRTDQEPGICIQVRDTGIGIAQDKLDRIFGRFYQVAESSTRAQGGIGLGLALVKEIVAAHGGTIDVVSEPEKGTTFTVVLPAVAEAGVGA